MNEAPVTMTECRWARPSSFALFLALFGTIVTLTSCAPRHAAEYPVEVAEVHGPGFTVRIAEFPEEHAIWLARSYYRFESRPSDSQNWVTAFEFRHKDDVPIPKQNVTFLTPQTAFVYMGWKYAVTTDGGRVWRVWDAQKDLAGWQCCNYGLIKHVELEQSGRGKMILNPILDRRGEVAELVTSDFGGHWAPPQSHD